MAVTFNIPGTISSRNKVANIDFNYGPYSGATEELALTAAHTALGALREKGVTVGIIVNGGPIQEYWYETTTVSSTDLKKKGATSGVQNSAYTTNSVLVGGASNGTTASVELTENTALGKVGANAPSAVPIKLAFTDVVAEDKDLVYSGAIKAYIDNLLASPLALQGGYNAFSNNPNLDGDPPIAGILKDHTWIVVENGEFFDKPVYIGDYVVALQSSPTALIHWMVIENRLNLATIELNGIVKLGQASTFIFNSEGQISNQTVLNNVVTLGVLKDILGVNNNLSVPKKFTTTILSTSTSATYIHSLNTKNAMVIIRQKNSPFQEVDADVEFTTDNSITITFLETPALNQYQLTVIG